MEKWVLYDKDRNYLNKVVDRDSALLMGEFHLSVHAWIECDNKFLIFQRDETKKILTNKTGISLISLIITIIVIIILAM